MHVLLRNATTDLPYSSDPVILLHLAATTPGDYELKSRLVVTNEFQPTEAVYPYFNVTKFWRKAIKTELQRLNNHSEDLRDHAWALGSIHSIAPGKSADVVGVVLVMHWMSCEPVENPMPLHPSPLVHTSRPSSTQWVSCASNDIILYADRVAGMFRDPERDT
jgi:hypothetical protein